MLTIPSMNRYLILSLLILTAAVATYGAETRPNIILIYTDDQGYSDLGCMGIMADVKTPNIDALASGGVRMTSGYVTAPQCSPSRCGLISGQYQGKFGMDHNGMLEDDAALLARFRDLNTLPKRMKAAGYVTGMAGKSHLGSDDSAELVKLGFDKAFFKHSNGPGHWNMDLTGEDIQPQVQKGGDYHLEMIADFGCSFIHRFKDRPMFLYLAFRGPHVPLDAPKKYLDRFPGAMPEERRKALASISCIDDGVGKLMAALRKNRLEENTLVFIISDNGAPLKQMPHEFVIDGNGLKTLMPNTPSGWDAWDGSLNEPMNGEKGMLTEGGIRVPFVVHWKGKIPGGQIYKNPVISLDVAATANALAGLPDDPTLDGVNLLPFLTGKNPGAPHDCLYWRWTNHHAIRKGNWKLIMYGSHPYLFDLATDPYEKKDLAKQQPEQVEALWSQLAKWTQTLIPAGELPEIEEGNDSSGPYGFYVDGKPRTKPGKGKSEVDTEQRLFTLRDKDQDGRVTLDEFLAGRTGDTVPTLTRRFKQLDRNGDGVWTKDEAGSSS